MTLKGLAEQLPNGFHDSEFKSILVDYDRRRVTIDVSVWVAMESSARELYRDGTLTITGLQFLVVEPPDERYNFADNRRLWVDLGDAPPKERLPAMGAIPTDCFASGFFVSDWNSFIYVAGRHAGLEWRGEPYDRSKNTSRLVAPSAAEGPAVLVKAPRRRQSIRILAAVASWAIAVWAGFVAASAAYVTFATNDYRPILIRGAWMGAIALVALHASALTAKGWKARSISVAGAILILVVLAEILGRLAAIAAHS